MGFVREVGTVVGCVAGVVFGDAGELVEAEEFTGVAALSAAFVACQTSFCTKRALKQPTGRLTSHLVRVGVDRATVVLLVTDRGRLDAGLGGDGRLVGV